MKKEVRINPTGAAVSAQVRFGHASVGAYRLDLYDADDRNPVTVLSGVSDDDSPDLVQMSVAASELVGRLLFLRAPVATATNDPDRVSVTCQILQGGQLRDSATISRNLNPFEEAVGSIAIRFRSA